MATRSNVERITFLRDITTGAVRMVEATERIHTNDGWDISRTMTWLADGNPEGGHPEIKPQMLDACNQLVQRVEHDRTDDYEVT
jgi:hypothetical protein